MKVGIIVGTNREFAVSEQVATYYLGILEKKQVESEIVRLRDLPQDFAFSALYGKVSEGFREFQDKLDSFDKMIFVVPEYNGSYPGVLKAFIDGLRHPDTLSNKKVALVGVSSGAYGNTVGVSNLNDVLSYLNANVLGMRAKLANIRNHFDGHTFSNQIYTDFINTQIETFLDF